MYRTLAGTMVDGTHLMTQEKLDELLGPCDYDGPSKSLIQLLFENPHQAGGLAQMAEAEAQALSRTHEGQQRLIAILMYIAEQQEKNLAAVDQLFHRLMLPKKDC